MDRVLKSHDFEVCYDATVVHRPDAPELLDGKATDRKFHALGSALESRTQNKPLILGRLFAAAISQQVALKTVGTGTSTPVAKLWRASGRKHHGTADGSHRRSGSNTAGHLVGRDERTSRRMDPEVQWKRGRGSGSGNSSLEGWKPEDQAES
ncbi:hypothetical protein EKO27_g1630 [Xylaria grammica]|uniref:Uncharacterized protein n=1 Tax=Xylaria grammica TaxID=363999 RepID=A0A439DGE5_9PEZI|nr:hypothetical protein EKO27_g1630 [Xylaria grammica]